MVRKRKNNTKMSLFAFQDVMASVIGILFFIVLLMSLDIVESSSESHNDSEHQKTVKTELLNDIDALDKRQSDILKRIELLEKQIIIVSTKDDQGILEGIDQYERSLNVLYSQLSQKNVSLNEQLKKIEINKQLYSQNKRQYDESELLITELKTQLDQQNDSPSLSYIIDSKVGMTPWLVELSGSSIRIASHDMSMIVDFNASSHDDREQLFMDWVKTRSIKSDYLVILIKPSGHKEFEGSFRRKIYELGFDIGTDLLPENKKVF